MRLALLVLLLAALPLFGQHEAAGEASKHPFIGDPIAIEAGAKLFASGCGACHGADGQGGRGPNLRQRGSWHPLDDKAMYKTVKQGIGAVMPASNMPENETWQVVAFVTSLTAPAIETAINGNVENGRVLFAGKGGCMNCHAINNQGGKMGPDLSNLASVRPILAIREAIIDPDADGSIGYHAVSVNLKNGKTLKGVARNRSNYSLQLQDREGNLHLINMADVTEMTLSKGSPMPKDYGKRFSASELDDLVAYLSRQSLRPFEKESKSK